MTDEYEPIPMGTKLPEKQLACPECGKPLARYEGRDKWRCKACNGVLVGHEALRVELGELADPILDEESDPDRVAARPCPVCAFAMSPYTVAFEIMVARKHDPDADEDAPSSTVELRKIELDRCLNDEIVWFDNSEIGKLRQLVAQQSTEEPVIMHLVEKVLEVQAEEQLLAAGAFDEIPREEPDPTTPQDWDNRKLCPDGACTGVLGPDGICHVCKRAAPV